MLTFSAAVQPAGRCSTCQQTTAALVFAGGELQRFAIAVVAAQAADIYMIDEPSSYLDVRQRLKAAQVNPREQRFACAGLPWHFSSAAWTDIHSLAHTYLDLSAVATDHAAMLHLLSCWLAKAWLGQQIVYSLCASVSSVHVCQDKPSS